MTDIFDGAAALSHDEPATLADMAEFEDEFEEGATPADAPASVPTPTVTVVIPARNEALNLPYVAERMPPVDEIIVVDGSSVDDTIAVARKLWPEAKIVSQTRSGKGNALACGFEAATGDIIVMIDADGSTDPARSPTSSKP